MSERNDTGRINYFITFRLSHPLAFAGKGSPRGQSQALSQNSIFPNFRGAHWIGSRPLRGAKPCVSLSAKSTFRGLPRRGQTSTFGMVRLGYCMNYPPL